MLLGILLAIGVAIFMGLPLLPVLVVGAFTHSVAAFALTRRKSLLHSAIGVAMSGITLLVVPALSDSNTGAILDKQTFDKFYNFFVWCTYGMSVLSLLISTMSPITAMRDQPS